MNTILIAQRLARHLDVPDPTDLPANAALDVLDAMNSGLQTVYANLPGIYRRTTLSHTFLPPVEVEIGFAAQFDRVLSSGQFDDAQACTVRIPGQPDNEVVDSTTLLDRYTGTDLSVTATVYRDAAPVEDVIERITGAVRLFGESGQCILTRDERIRERRRDDCPPGQPRHYYIDPVGASQGGSPEFFLRVWPLPDAVYTVRMEAELGPKRMTFYHLSQAVELPLADRWVEDLFLPVAEARLTRSHLWRDRGKISRIEQDAADVLANKIPRVAPQIAPSENRVGTPKGF